MVGHSPAIAGRSMPGIVCRLNFAMAISAPVLPADTATSASPFFTASSASHIEDFHRPCRSAWLGFASILTTVSVCTMREAALSRSPFSTSGRMTFWSPKKMNSASGWRASARSAPGTTTLGPKSPPIPSSAIRTFWAIGSGRVLMWEMAAPLAREERFGGRAQSALLAHLFLDCAVFLQCREPCKRVAFGIGRSLGGVKGHAGLARIGIDPKDEEFGRDEPEVHGISDERLYLVARGGGIEVDFRCLVHLLGGWRERYIDGLADVVHDRIKCDDAGLPNSAAHLPAHMQLVASASRQIEPCDEPLDRMDPGRFGERGAHRLACLQLDMAAGLADRIEPRRGAPWALGRRHHRSLRGRRERSRLQKNAQA